MRAGIAMALVAGFCLAGCGDDDDGGGTGDGGGADARMADAGCAKRWTTSKVGTAAVSSAMVEGGALVLRSAMSGQTDVLNVTSAMSLTGDFTVVLKYEAFVSGGMGAFSQAALADKTLTNGPFVTAGIGTFPVVGLGVTFQNPGGIGMTQPTTATSGEFKFQRVGGMLTATATAAGGTPVATAMTTFSTTPVQFGVQIGSNNQTFNPESSIKYTDVIVTGGGAGGAAQNDDFSCDSITR